MKTLKIQNLTSKVLKNEEVKCGNYRVGFEDGYYYAGSLFNSTQDVCVDTLKELKEWLSINK